MEEMTPVTKRQFQARKPAEAVVAKMQEAERKSKGADSWGC